MSATVLNRYIYAIGGYDGRLRMRSTERYDSSINQWNQVASMQDRRSDAGASAMGGMVMLHDPPPHKQAHTKSFTATQVVIDDSF